MHLLPTFKKVSNIIKLNCISNVMNQFQEISKIGEGSFGCVYKAKDSNNNFVALKHIKYESNQQGIPANALREISLLKSISQHPNIIKIIKVHYQAVQSKLCIAFEYCQCDLKRYIKQKKTTGISQEQIKKIMRQLLSGISVLHNKKIIHRDIKPQNIMLDAENNIKIGDFGLARHIASKQKTLTREVQTLWYRAPQVMMGMKYYSFPIDVWAIGCIFAQLFLKRPLFLGGQYQIQQIFKIFEILGSPTKQQWPTMQNLPDFSIKYPKWKKQDLKSIIKNMPDQALDLLQKMLIYDPQKRITAFEALNHPYLF